MVRERIRNRHWTNETKNEKWPALGVLLAFEFPLCERGVQLVYLLTRNANLLVTTGLNMGEIADRCSFADQGYFARQFRKRIGMAPREYRKGRNDS
ncbi:MAG: AraC-like DNA-binding protein [Rhodothermales bacterium]|jgi:AraC-like DNA-binding protein